LKIKTAFFITIKENGEKSVKILKDSKFKNLEIKQNLKYLVEESTKIYESFVVVSEANNSDYAFFYELNTKTKNLILNAILVNTGEQFSKLFKEKRKNFYSFYISHFEIFKRFCFFKDRIGINISKRKYKEEVFVSSFDYKNQMKIFCFKNIGDPNTEQFMDNVINFYKKRLSKKEREHSF